MRRLDVPALVREASGSRKRHAAGNGLSLFVQGTGATWQYQYRDPSTKKTRTAGLGPALGVGALTITEARNKRTLKAAEVLSGAPPPVRIPTGSHSFSHALSAYLDVNASAWKGKSDGAEAKAYRSLTKLGLAKLDVASIDSDTIVATLDPWKGTPTAEKLRIRIKSVLDYAIAKGWRDGANPARREIMKQLMPPVVANGNGDEDNGHKALPWKDVPVLMAELRKCDTEAARALQFLILTAGRAGEIMGARWSEIEGDTWTIPSERMKEGKRHTVPLAPEALALLGKRGDGLIFTLARGAMRIELQKLRPGVTVHGF